MPKSCTIAQMYFIAHEDFYIAIGCKRIKLPARIVSLMGSPVGHRLRGLFRLFRLGAVIGAANDF